MKPLKSILKIILTMILMMFSLSTVSASASEYPDALEMELSELTDAQLAHLEARLQAELTPAPLTHYQYAKEFVWKHKTTIAVGIGITALLLAGAYFYGTPALAYTSSAFSGITKKAALTIPAFIPPVAPLTNSVETVQAAIDVAQGAPAVVHLAGEAIERLSTVERVAEAVEKTSSAAAEKLVGSAERTSTAVAEKLVGTATAVAEKFVGSAESTSTAAAERVVARVAADSAAQLAQTSVAVGEKVVTNRVVATPKLTLSLPSQGLIANLLTPNGGKASVAVAPVTDGTRVFAQRGLNKNGAIAPEPPRMPVGIARAGGFNLGNRVPNIPRFLPPAGGVSTATNALRAIKAIQGVRALARIVL